MGGSQGAACRARGNISEPRGEAAAVLDSGTRARSAGGAGRGGRRDKPGEAEWPAPRFVAPEPGLVFICVVNTPRCERAEPGARPCRAESGEHLQGTCRGHDAQGHPGQGARKTEAAARKDWAGLGKAFPGDTSESASSVGPPRTLGLPSWFVGEAAPPETHHPRGRGPFTDEDNSGGGACQFLLRTRRHPSCPHIA